MASLMARQLRFQRIRSVSQSVCSVRQFTSSQSWRDDKPADPKDTDSPAPKPEEDHAYTPEPSDMHINAVTVEYGPEKVKPGHAGRVWRESYVVNVSTEDLTKEQAETAVAKVMERLEEEAKFEDAHNITEDNLPDYGPHEEFKFDELTPFAHRRIEQHRYKRMYNRAAAWEMPALRELATPFVPKDAAKAEVFKFRYTSFMGHNHKAESKVVVEAKVSEVASAYFNRDQAMTHKFKVLAGPRYNAFTDIFKMNAEHLPNSVQNKRYIVDTLKQLIRESRNLEQSFAHIPVDTRHAKKKKTQPKFPDAWKRPQDATVINPLTEFAKSRRHEFDEKLAQEVFEKVLRDGAY